MTPPNRLYNGHHSEAFNEAMALVRTLALSLMAASLVACGSKDTDNNPNPNPNPNPTDAKLQSLSISVAETTIDIGAQLTLSVEGVYDDATTKDLTDLVGYASSDPSVLAPVDGTANAFDALIAGPATITVSHEGVTATIDIVVSAPRVTGLEIIPSQADICMGAPMIVAVIATYSDGAQETVTDQVDWGSSNEFVLRASATDVGRLVTFGSEGSADITARFGAVEATGSYNVGAACVTYIQVSSGVGRIGDTPVQLTATGYWSDERREDVTSSATWTSSDPSIVAVDASGLATRVTDGEVVITAQSGTVSGSFFLRTIGASVCGDYPTNHAEGIGYGSVAAPMFWLDAFTETGENVDFFFEDLPCDAANYSTALFVVGAGWCPYCPDFKRRIDGMQDQLNAAGMRVFYIETEVAGGSGAPATNAQANQIINMTLAASTNPSIRFGDADAQGGVNIPFARAVRYLPNAFVIRTTDMEVIAAGQNHNFLNIANNPEMSYGSN